MTVDLITFMGTVISVPSPSKRPAVLMAEAFLCGYVLLKKLFPAVSSRVENRLPDEVIQSSWSVPDDDLLASLQVALAGGMPYCLGPELAGKDQAGRIVALMQIVDVRSRVAHPSQDSSFAPARSRTGSLEFDQWSDRYEADGSYADIELQWHGNTERHSLLPRGPLRSDPPVGGTDRGTHLQDFFAYLCVAGPNGDYKTTVVRQATSTRWRAPRRGAFDASFSAVPVCTVPSDIQYPVVSNLVRPQVASSLDMDAIAAEALAESIADGTGMGVLPEFVGGHRAAGPLSRLLKDAALRRGPLRPALWICGTSLVNDAGTMRNRCRILNGDGRPVLPYQDKIHANYATREAIHRWTGADPGPEARYFEDFESGNHVVLIDDESWGRVMVLVCEDLKQADPRARLCSEMRPDWLIVPILDGQIYESGHWAETSAKSAAIESSKHTRVVVVNAVGSAFADDPTATEVCFAIGIEPAAARLAETPAEIKNSQTRPFSPRVRRLHYVVGSSRRSVPMLWDPNSGDWKVD